MEFIESGVSTSLPLLHGSWWTEAVVPFTVSSIGQKDLFPWFGLILWHINHWRLFNPKSIFIHINSFILNNAVEYKVGWLGFMATFEGYLTANSFYANIQFYFKQFNLVKQFYYKQFSSAEVHSLIVKNISTSSYSIQSNNSV